MSTTAIRFTAVTPNLLVRDVATRALETQPYGMREFSVVDSDGHVLTFALRVGGEG